MMQEEKNVQLLEAELKQARDQMASKSIHNKSVARRRTAILAAVGVALVVVAAAFVMVVVQMSTWQDDVSSAVALENRENLTRHKSSRQSSTEGRAKASLAVDGCNDCGGTDDVTRTRREPSPWWEVDLECNYEINEVCVTVGDHCDACMSNLRVFISDEPLTSGNIDTAWDAYLGHVSANADGKICIPVQNPYRDVNTCDKCEGKYRPFVHGRFVRVQQVVDGILSLCEVEVFGKEIEQPCDTGTDRCHRHATCIPQQYGQYTCKCKDGFFGDGRSCNREDVCEVQNVCHRHAQCNPDHGKPKCTCKDGWMGDGHECALQNHCAAKVDRCHPKATCQHAPETTTGYTCQCADGWKGDGFRCTEDLL
eukprot:GFYU01009588.1.p1 GENE.GFYU01009588.1~~GFYU01009588.1.p1  ORF type:complete len:367 (+),score=111.42 GFYU01009588.1:181-1281(+)